MQLSVADRSIIHLLPYSISYFDSYVSWDLRCSLCLHTVKETADLIQDGVNSV